jgi:hypothetical protein
LYGNLERGFANLLAGKHCCQLVNRVDYIHNYFPKRKPLLETSSVVQYLHSTNFSLGKEIGKHPLWTFIIDIKQALFAMWTEERERMDRECSEDGQRKNRG